MRKHQISGATKAWHSILAFLLIVMFTFGFEGIVVPQTSKSTAVEVKGSHAVYVSQPQAVAAVIETAARESAK